VAGTRGPATMPAREAARVRSGVEGTATTSVGMGGQDPWVTRDGYGVAAGGKSDTVPVPAGPARQNPRVRPNP